MNTLRRTLFIVMATITINGLAEQTNNHKNEAGHKHGSHIECPLPSEVNDIIKCALIYHPSVRLEGYNLDVSEAQYEEASQFVNPTLSGRYVTGDADSEDISELEANLAFTVRLGGKRSSQRAKARAYGTNAKARLEVVKSQIKIETIKNLYRLRQVRDEVKITEQTIKAFDNVLSKLKKLSRLSAKQEASLALIELSYEEMKVSRAQLYEEERKIEHFFHISTGHSLSEIERFIPKQVKKWPKLSTVKKVESSSADIKRLKSLSDIALQELEIQKSQAWPDIQIGPSVAIEKEGGQENTMVGLNLTIPIPVFTLNSGAKQHAHSKLMRTQKTVELMQAQEGHERFEQFRVYNSSVNTLTKTMKRKEIEKRYKKIEELYQRGIVDSSTYLDSINQKSSYIKSRNRRELAALEALWNVYQIDGRVLEEKL